MSNVVVKDDINEAMRLMEMSKDSLNAEERQQKWVNGIRFLSLISVKNIKIATFHNQIYDMYAYIALGINPHYTCTFWIPKCGHL